MKAALLMQMAVRLRLGDGVRLLRCPCGWCKGCVSLEPRMCFQAV